MVTLGCVNEMDYLKLRNRHTGYIIVTTRQIITHLHAQYSNITPQYVQENDVRMKMLFDVSMPIEELHDEIENSVEPVDVGKTPYTSQQVVVIAYSLVFNTAMFMDTRREWKCNNTGHKTWTNFKIDFGLAYKELRENQVTVQSFRFSPQNVNVMQEFQTKTTEAIDNLANKKMVDRIGIL